MATTCCSIEMEPRTLNEGQLNQAREVAVDIVQKLEPNEASNAFTEGLRSVVPIKEMEQVGKGDELEIPVEHMEKAQIINGKPCQCSCSPTIIDSPDQADLREPLSAPF
ncbi:hypothetical protein L1049_004157 [Liquidambar formosana]|uniref:Uncharacterized protein n=1 Tax=Liquidambar formosana TaxID=63359 RepID=A0AAP0WY43_LIQFO